MTRKSKFIATGDCETDPFKKGRIPEPFIWGSYDGAEFLTFDTAHEFVEHWRHKNCYMFFHNGGKFDFMYLLPHFEETTVQIINGRIVSISIGNMTLRDSLAMIPLAQKNFGKTEFDYWKLEQDCRAEHMPEILAYLKDDVVFLHQMVSRYFDLVGKKSTIASNALSFAKSLGIDPGRTNPRFDRIFRPFYFGGRVQAFKPGSHGTTDIYDIASAYPYAMEHMLPSGKIYIAVDDIDSYPEDEINKSFIHLKCYSDGAFPVIRDHTLHFPHEYGEFKITGWEYNVARKHGLIRDIEIIDALILEDEITFKPYTDHWFDFKSKVDKETNLIDYTISKIMLNSLYGKLAQNPVNYYKYKVMRAGTRPDIENGWQLDAELGSDFELHAKSMLAEYEEKYGDDWIWQDIHFNVATAASITGFTRSMLLDAAATVGFDNVLYCDTDCLFVKGGTDVSGLRLNDGLGSWEPEGTASEVHIGGKKLYAAKIGKKFKTASKGARLKFSDIKKIVKGKTVKWENEAPTFSLGKAPVFMVRRVTATAKAENATNRKEPYHGDEIEKDPQR